MENGIQIVPSLEDTMVLCMNHLLEALNQMNRNLATISETLDAIANRMNYATVLDNND